MIFCMFISSWINFCLIQSNASTTTSNSWPTCCWPASAARCGGCTTGSYLYVMNTSRCMRPGSTIWPVEYCIIIIRRKRVFPRAQKVDIAALGVPNSPYGHSGCKATMNWIALFFVEVMSVRYIKIYKITYTPIRQSSGAVWKSRWPSWAPVPNKPTVSVDVKKRLSSSPISYSLLMST